MNQESAFDKLNKLYRALLAPTTFLVLVTWQYSSYMVNIALQYDVPFKIDPNNRSSYLLAAPRMLSFEVFMLTLSLFFYLLVIFEKETKLVWVSKFISFSCLLITLFLTASPFLTAEVTAFLLVREVPSGELLIPAVAAISILLTILLFYRAKKTAKK